MNLFFIGTKRVLQKDVDEGMQLSVPIKKDECLVL